MILIVLLSVITKEIITYENPFLILNSPVLNTIEVKKDTNTIPFILKGDTLYPDYELKKRDTLFVFYESFFYKKDTTIFIPENIPENENFLNEKKDKEENFINYKGEKTLSLGLSDKGFNVEQSLHFKINGKIGKDYRVEGVISDESYPEGESFTRNLSELEEASIKIKGKNFSSRLGEFRAESGILKNFRKDILGLELNFRNLKFTIGYPKGKFKTVYIDLSEKRTNTFYLVDPLKEKIVPGSEKVFLDGKPLKYGRENDYVIDYINGTISLTPNVFYTYNSKLRVDFEVTEEGYTSYSLFSEYRNTFKDFNLSFFVFNESDIKTMSKISLDEEDISYLKTVQDTSWILLNGINLVDSGKGSYILKNDTLFYVGEGKGNINPDFVFVGPQNGDYEYVDDKGYFVYVGEGKGNYKIGKWGITPKRLQNFVFNLNGHKKFYVLNYTSGISYFTPNLFNNNKKGGYFNDFNFKLKVPSSITPSIELKILNKKDFKAPFRIEEENYFNFWGKKIKGNFFDFRVIPKIEYKNLFSISYLYSKLLNENFDLKKEIYRFSSNFFLISNFSFERIYFNNSDLKRINFYAEKEFVLSYFYKHFYEIDTLKKKKSEEILGLKYEKENYRLLYELLSFRLGEFREIKHAFKFNIKVKNLISNTSISFSKRREGVIEKKNFEYFTENIFYFLDDSYFNFVSSLRKINQKGKILEYIFVGEGRGNYSYDSLSKVFYPDPYGSYIKRERIYSLNQSVSFYENEGSLFLNFEPFQFQANIISRLRKHDREERYLSVFASVTGDILMNPYINFLKTENKNYFFYDYLITENLEVDFGVKNYLKDDFFYDAGLNFKDEHFEGSNNKFEKNSFYLPFSLNLNLKKRELRFKFAPYYFVINYEKPYKEKFSSFGLSFYNKFLFLFKRLNIQLNFEFLIKKPYEREFVSELERDNWRYKIDIRIERNLNKNFILSIRGNYIKGSFSKSVYNLFIDSRLLF